MFRLSFRCFVFAAGAWACSHVVRVAAATQRNDDHELACAVALGAGSLQFRLNQLAIDLEEFVAIHGRPPRGNVKEESALYVRYVRNRDRDGFRQLLTPEAQKVLGADHWGQSRQEALKMDLEEFFQNKQRLPSKNHADEANLYARFYRYAQDPVFLELLSPSLNSAVRAYKLSPSERTALLMNEFWEQAGRLPEKKTEPKLHSKMLQFFTSAEFQNAVDPEFRQAMKDQKIEDQLYDPKKRDPSRLLRELAE